MMPIFKKLKIPDCDTKGSILCQHRDKEALLYLLSSLKAESVLFIVKHPELNAVPATKDDLIVILFGCKW